MNNEPHVKKRRWSSVEDSYFLDVWEEQQPTLSGQNKNSHIYREMAKAMLAAGFPRTAQDIRCRIYNLSKKYREIRNACTTGSSPPSWRLYGRIQQIIGSYATSPERTTDVNHYILTDESSEDENTCQKDLIYSELQDHDYQVAAKSIKIETEPQSLSKSTKDTVESDSFVTIHGANAPRNSVTTQCIQFPGELPVISIVWGEKILGLEPSQRFLAEKAINDILFEASQGNLSCSATATTGINIRGHPFSF